MSKAQEILEIIFQVDIHNNCYIKLEHLSCQTKDNFLGCICLILFHVCLHSDSHYTNNMLKVRNEAHTALHTEACLCYKGGEKTRKVFLKQGLPQAFTGCASLQLEA